MGPGTSPNDPVFFLHHCNVDRIWALWQYAHPASAYLPASGRSARAQPERRHAAADDGDATPAGSPRLPPHDGLHLRHRSAAGGSGHADGEFPGRARRSRRHGGPRCSRCAPASTIHLEIVPGSGPSAPYGITALGTSVTHVPPVDNAPYDDVRLWFAFTGTAAPGRRRERQRSDSDASRRTRSSTSHSRRTPSRVQPPASSSASTSRAAWACRRARAGRGCSFCTRPRHAVSS